MAVTKAEKEQELQDLTNAFKATDTAILVDYKGLDVPGAGCVLLPCHDLFLLGSRPRRSGPCGTAPEAAGRPAGPAGNGAGAPVPA